MADNIWTAAVEGIAARGRANNGTEGDYRDEASCAVASAEPGKKATSRSAKRRFAFRTCANANQKPVASVKPKKRPPNSGSNANDFAKTESLIRRTCPRTSPRTTTATPEFPTCAAAMWNTGRK